ncbi:peptide/nitrate transporter-like protein [Hapsidospora chrysogenum ATCC 11550]|uniref:Peptide/nitrate transporter-like protein n=1 Tax=Hapsidospora chrysogenum (strain ATCC 11550 / CBS 779.69 / DSM 880 / IAM 14645 / JCM 23072 / IMI 49137) TaxID=857340 RepID=A0A086STX1_HAPC1|nr:peptide/nitrate transporter-like protein [Hapsidospora chrysogenum ATCC 11550]
MESERQPLLGAGQASDSRPSSTASTPRSLEASAPGEHAKEHEGSIPWLQLSLLCLARMMDPVVFCSIFPYIAAMVHHNTNLAVSDTGFYSGLIESLFAIVQTGALMLWSSLSDAIGRKEALICSLIGTAIGSSLFGMSTTLWQMFLFRCVTGLFGASNLITRTMISECVPRNAHAQAFSWLVFAANAGGFVGPMIGGALADPSQQYPSLFGDSQWLKDNPYALSGIVVGAISAGIALSSVFWLRGTQPTIDNAAAGKTAPSQLSSLRRLVSSPGVPITLGVYLQSKILTIATSAILAVYLYTPVETGGAGLSTVHISLYMAVRGGSQMLWLLLAFPFLNGRLGTKRVLSVVATAWPFIFGGYILMNVMLRSTSNVVHQWLWFAVAPAVVLFDSATIMSQTSVQLAINDASPSPEYLAKINALALVGNGLVGAVTPGTSSAIYAVGARGDILSGHLAWAVLILLSLGFCLLVRWLPHSMKN